MEFLILVDVAEWDAFEGQNLSAEGALIIVVLVGAQPQLADHLVLVSSFSIYVGLQENEFCLQRIERQSGSNFAAPPFDNLVHRATNSQNGKVISTWAIRIEDG
jgi:hypothetical protein